MRTSQNEKQKVSTAFLHSELKALMLAPFKGLQARGARQKKK